MLRAIEKVAAGEGYVDPALMPAFMSGKDKDDMPTGREREILQLLADGMSNADVASKLFISQETVKSHVRHILAKLEADTRTHAVAIALRKRSSIRAARPPRGRVLRGRAACALREPGVTLLGAARLILAVARSPCSRGSTWFSATRQASEIELELAGQGRSSSR